MPIELKNLSFSFDELQQPLFENINLTVDTNWRLGLVGRNGRGKTTLLKLLMQHYPYTGELFSSEDFVYFPVQIKDEEKMVYEAIDEVMPTELWQLQKECQLLNLHKDILWQPFKELSGGEQTKVLLAALFCEGSRFALLDEPTNHLDLEGRKSVARYLQQKQGYIVVSHDQLFLDEVVDHILVIEKRQIALFKGNYSTYLLQKNKQDEFELAQNKALKTEIQRLQSTAREKANWADQREKPSGNDPFGNAIAKRMNKRAKAIEGRTQEKIEEKTKLLHNIETVKSLSIQTLKSHRNPVLTMKNFTLSFNGRPLFQPISFELLQGEQVALIGPNGSGKTVLLNYLRGGHFAGEVHGELVISPALTCSSIRQNHADNTGTLQQFATQQQIDYTLFLRHLRILGMERDVFQIPIDNMSSGQKKKVELARSLGQLAELYIWDEPLNYLDLFNREQIETMLRSNQPTLLFVEHDEQFIANIATKKIHLIHY